MASPLPLRLTPPAALGSRLAARGGMAAALVGRGAGAFGRRPSAAIPPLACARCEGQLRALWLGSWRRSGGTEHTLLSGVEGRRLVRMFTVSTKRRSGAPKGTETEEEESKAETGARYGLFDDSPLLGGWAAQHRPRSPQSLASFLQGRRTVAFLTALAPAY